MADRAHYPSGEPGTSGREPFEDDSIGGVPKTGANAGTGFSGSASDSHHIGGTGHSGSGLDGHGGTIARDTEVRGGQVVGLAGPTDSGVGGHESHSHSHSAGQGAGLGAGAGLAAGSGHQHDSGKGPHFGEEHSSVAHGGAQGRQDHDKTGHLDQQASKYEATGAGGPTSSGAANTDRFDAPSHGNTGAGAGGNYGSSDVRSPPDVTHDDSHRKGTGGIGGILGTSDKDFTANPSRTGQGAYHDSDGRYQTNTSGPSGNSALTGREGNLDNNPVAQSQSRQQGEALSHGHGHGDETGEKPGMMDKIKQAFK